MNFFRKNGEYLPKVQLTDEKDVTLFCRFCEHCDANKSSGGKVADADVAIENDNIIVYLNSSFYNFDVVCNAQDGEIGSDMSFYNGEVGHIETTLHNYMYCGLFSPSLCGYKLIQRIKNHKIANNYPYGKKRS